MIEWYAKEESKRLLLVVWLFAVVMTVVFELYTLVAPLLLVLVVAVSAPAALKAHVARQKAIRKVEKHTNWPRLLANTLELDKGERVVYETRMHPVVIFWNKWLLAPMLMLVPGIWFGSWVLVLVATAVFCVVSTPAAVNWWFTRRCYTTWRIIEATGILSKRMANVSLTSIDNAYHIEKAALNRVFRMLGLPEVCLWHIDTRIEEPFNDLAWSIISKKLSAIYAPYIKGKSQS